MITTNSVSLSIFCLSLCFCLTFWSIHVNVDDVPAFFPHGCHEVGPAAQLANGLVLLLPELESQAGLVGLARGAAEGTTLEEKKNRG